MLKASSPSQASEGLDRPARWLGLRRSALLEMGLFFIGVLLLDTWAFDGSRFWDVELHPFWIIVLLISAQYGTGEGLLAAVLASLALLAFNLPVQGLSQDMYDYVYAVTRKPVFWFIAALTLGELRMRQLREGAQLRGELAQAQKREETLAVAYKRLGQIKDRLETRVAGQLRTGISIYQAAKAIEKLEPNEVLLGVVDVVRSVMKPEKFSLYLLSNHDLNLSIEEGWSPDDSFSQQFRSDSAMFQEVIGRQRSLCSANADDQLLLGEEGMLAAPLVAPDTGEVLGMLKVEALGFLDFNFSNVHTFRILCEWIATAYGNAKRYQSARSASVLNTETQLLSYGFFARETGFLTELASRIGFDLCMLVIRLENSEELTEEERSLISGALGEAVARVLRKSDLVFDYQRTGWEFAVVLPGTPLENANIVANKLLQCIQEHLNGRARQARFGLSSQSLHHQDLTKDSGYGLLPHQFLGRQTQSLTHLAKRQGFDLTMVVFRLTDADDMSRDQRNLAPGIMNQAIRDVLAGNGAAFAYQRSDLEFALVLPATSMNEAQQVARTLEGALQAPLERYSREAHFTFTIQSIHHQAAKEPSYALQP